MRAARRLLLVRLLRVRNRKRIQSARGGGRGCIAGVRSHRSLRSAVRRTSPSACVQIPQATPCRSRGFASAHQDSAQPFCAAPHTQQVEAPSRHRPIPPGNGPGIHRVGAGCSLALARKRPHRPDVRRPWYEWHGLRGRAVSPLVWALLLVRRASRVPTQLEPRGAPSNKAFQRTRHPRPPTGFWHTWSVALTARGKLRRAAERQVVRPLTLP